MEKISQTFSMGSDDANYIQTGRQWRWGLYSTAKIAHDFAKALTRVKEAQLWAVGSRSFESANKFADDFNIPNRYGSYDDLVKDKNLDVIYIATPHSEHYEGIKHCLENGHNVVCEKPFALNASQTEEMIQLARSKNLFLMEGFWSRFLPSYRKLKEILRDGLIGQVHSVQADIGYNAKKKADVRDRIFKPELAGGGVMDIGCYGVQLASLVFGQQPTQIKALAEMAHTGVDEQCIISLKYGGGQLACITTAVNMATPGDAWIIGENGRVLLHGSPHFNCSTRMTLFVEGEKPQHFEFPLKEKEGEFIYPNTSLFVHEAQEVHRCLSLGLKECPEMPLNETLHLMQTLDTIRKEIGLVYPKEQLYDLRPIQMTTQSTIH